MRSIRIASSALAAAALCGMAQVSSASQIYSAGGFDTTSRFDPAHVQVNSPPDTEPTGTLHGQDAGQKQWFFTSNGIHPTNNPTAGNITAVVQTSNVNTATQSIQLTRTSADGYFFPDVTFTPVNGVSNYISISWSMKLAAPGSNATHIGPFFGIEAYGTHTGNGTPLRIGAFGIEQANDALSYVTANGTGGEEGVQLNSIQPDGNYHTFKMAIDFTSKTYNIYIDGAAPFAGGHTIGGIPFSQTNGGSIDNFTDADITAYALTQGGLTSDAAGTAYFDDYAINAVPEPTTASLLVLGAAGLGLRRRNRAQA